MYQHVMIPMDGSKLSECVLPHLEMMAKTCKIPQVTLIHVVTPVRYFDSFNYTGMDPVIPVEQMKSIEENNAQDAKSYLGEKVKQLEAKGITAKAVVITGFANEVINNYAKENKVDMIIIATHGRSGISRWFWGSTAEKILRTSKIPVLMIRPDSCGVEE